MDPWQELDPRTKSRTWHPVSKTLAGNASPLCVLSSSLSCAPSRAFWQPKLTVKKKMLIFPPCHLKIPSILYTRPCLKDHKGEVVWDMVTRLSVVPGGLALSPVVAVCAALGSLPPRLGQSWKSCFHVLWPETGASVSTTLSSWDPGLGSAGPSSQTGNASRHCGQVRRELRQGWASDQEERWPPLASPQPPIWSGELEARPLTPGRVHAPRRGWQALVRQVQAAEGA